MHGVFGVVEEERLFAVLIHPGQRLVAKGVGEVAPLAVHIGVLGEAHIVGSHVDIEATAGRAASRTIAAAPEVPHADQGRGVPLAAQHVSDCLGVGGELIVAAGRNHLHVGLPRRVALVDHRVDAVARRVLPGQQAGPSRGAIRGTGVTLGEDRAGAGEFVEVRRVDVPVAGETWVAPAHVIDQDEDDVGWARFGEGGRTQ